MIAYVRQARKKGSRIGEEDKILQEGEEGEDMQVKSS